MDRFNQMSGQASLIAKKKQEIEAKRKAQQEAAQNSGSVSLYNQLSVSSKSNNVLAGPRQQKALPIGNLKNRWGFKGKSSPGSQRSTATATSTSAELKNTFSNDGSFIEQFKKMQDSKDTSSEIPKNTLERSEYSSSNQSKSNIGHSSYSTSCNTKSQKDILSTPPPPPPNFINVQKNEKEDNNMDKPKEADEWYKQALERARNIAKNLGQSTNNASQSKPEISCHKSTGDVPSQIAYGNNEQLKLERGVKPDFSMPPPPVLSNFTAPPPPIALEYGSSTQLSLLGHSSVEQSFGSDAKPSKSTLYSPTKPTTTPTKSEVKSEDTLSAGDKVLLADCMLPIKSGTSDASDCHNLDNHDSYKVVDQDDLKDIILTTVAEELASMVACSGDQLENIAKNHNAGMDESEMAFLYDTSSTMYKKYRQRIDSLRKGMVLESHARIREAEDTGDDIAEGTETSSEKETRKRKRRWGDENDKVPLGAPILLPTPGVLPSGPLKNVGKNNPELIQYAIRVFGSTDLTDSQWKQCEDQIKMSMVYNEMLTKKKQVERLAQKGHNKYEYDSDEETEGGTWEHKARKLEMSKTLDKSTKQTEAGKGMHHIGDFLPPEELTKFMNKFKALQNGEEFDDSDYVEHKITNENLGFKMLERMGWSEGKGLGQEGAGITAPVGKSGTGADKKGLGVSEVHNLEAGDDEFEAYRKRMMMAYRFRPNPLNNPRRAYY